MRGEILAYEELFAQLLGLPMKALTKNTVWMLATFSFLAEARSEAVFLYTVTPSPAAAKSTGSTLSLFGFSGAAQKSQSDLANDIILSNSNINGAILAPITLNFTDTYIIKPSYGSAIQLFANQTLSIIPSNTGSPIISDTINIDSSTLSGENGLFFYSLSSIVATIQNVPNEQEPGSFSYNGAIQITITEIAIPEPSSLTLFGIAGIVSLGLYKFSSNRGNA